jgi:biotin synthase
MGSSYLEVFEWDLVRLIREGTTLRERYFGKRVMLCSIVNAKSGRCSEDCAFCAQSVHHRAQIEVYPLLEPERILEEAKKASLMGARRFSIVTSGRALSQRDFDKVLKAVELIRKETDLLVCSSLGFLDLKRAKALKEAGLSRYHHNLETSPSYFPKICTTHSIQEKIETILCAKEAGLSVCSGGIIGLGEGREERLELALKLRELEVDSVALNYFHPIPGTKLENQNSLTPMEFLRTVTLFRLILPSKEIRLTGGRAYGLRDLQPLGILCGANGLMIGNYLTTRGRPYEMDLRMLSDLELQIDDG